MNWCQWPSVTLGVLLAATRDIVDHRELGVPLKGVFQGGSHTKFKELDLLIGYPGREWSEFVNLDVVCLTLGTISPRRITCRWVCGLTLERGSGHPGDEGFGLRPAIAQLLFCWSLSVLQLMLLPVLESCGFYFNSQFSITVKSRGIFHFITSNFCFSVYI